MSEEVSVKFWNSIVIRLALFFTGLILCSILISGYLVYTQSSKVIIDNSLEKLKYSRELAEQQFYSLLEEVQNDINVISSNPLLKNYVNNFTLDSRSDLSEFFEVVISNKPEYFQLRLIGTENNGKELIRFNKMAGVVIKVNETDLQEKGDRDYFIKAKAINANNIYFSSINLNQEYGEIDLPHVITLRAAKPVFNNHGDLKAVLVINVNLNKLFKAFDQISESDSKVLVIDENGQYIYSSERSILFSDQLNTNFNFFNEFNIDRSEILTTNQLMSVKSSTKFLNSIEQVKYFEEQRSIYFISLIEEEVLLKSAIAIRRSSLKQLVVVALFSILLSYLFTRLLASRINRITLALTKFGEGKGDKITESRNDEIGVLTKSFVKMRVKIDSQVKELNESLEKEKEAKDQRDEFLQNMSHELRTPLNAILGLSNLLLKNSDKGVQPIVNSLNRSAKNLEGLVYDVLDHKKLVEGKLELKFENINLRDLIKNIYSDYQFEAVSKNLNLNLLIEDSVEGFFKTDALRFSQILINLIVNSIKYTKSGGIAITANYDDEKKQLLVKVKDTGIGLSEKNLSLIKSKDSIQNNISGRYGSYGLGLTIVKELILLFSGSIEVTSEEHKGTEFVIILPIERSEVSVAKATPALYQFEETDRQSLEHQTIVHIEDDEPTLNLIKYKLQNYGIELIQLTNMEKVEEYLLENDQPDIILSDLMLGGQNIYAQLEEFKKRELILCPLIICSALDKNSVNSSVDYYFQKPLDLDMLIQVVLLVGKKKRYSSPHLIDLYNDYDNDLLHIKRVLELQIVEFNDYRVRLLKAFENADENEWQAIKHKLITHIKNLKLRHLESFMDMKLVEFSKEQKLEIVRIIEYYIQFFEVELKVNLKD